MKKGLVLMIALLLSWAATAQYGSNIFILNSRAAEYTGTLFYDTVRYELKGQPQSDFIILNDERNFYLAADTAMRKSDSLLQMVYRKVSVYINSEDFLDVEKMPVLLLPDENLVKHEVRILRKDGSIKLLPNTYVALNGVLRYLKIPSSELAVGDQLDIVQTVLTPLEITGIVYFRTAYPVQRTAVTFELPPNSNMVFSSYNLENEVTLLDEEYWTGYRLEEPYTNPVYHVTFDSKTYEKALGYTIRNINKMSLNAIDEKLFTEWMFSVVNNVDPADAKWVDRFLSKNGILKIGDKKEQVKAVELAVKKMILTKKDGLVLAYSHPLITQKISQAEKAGAIHIAVVNRILMLAFDQLQIPYELYLGRNKYVSPFKEDLAALENGSNLIFFFPQYKGYIYPAAVFFRFPLAESLYLDNDATLLDLTTYKGVKGMVPKKGYLKFYGDKDGNRSEMHYELAIQDQTARIKVNKSSDGEFAMMYAATEEMYKRLAQNGLIDLKKNYIAGILNWDADTAVVIRSLQYDPVKGDDWNAASTYTAKAELESRKLITVTEGNSMVLDIGKLIGQQDSIPDVAGPYDITISFPHNMHITIAIDIPDGYTIAGALSAWDKVLDYKANGLYYIRKAKLDGKRLVIDIAEGYTATGFAKKDFEKYKEVINAAREFNGMQLVLEKK